MYTSFLRQVVKASIRARPVSARLCTSISSTPPIKPTPSSRPSTQSQAPFPPLTPPPVSSPPSTQPIPSSPSSTQPESPSPSSAQPVPSSPPLPQPETSSASSTQPTSSSSSSATGPHASRHLPTSDSTTFGSSSAAESSRATGHSQRESEAHIREQLQNAVLERVPTLGWTASAVRDALSSLGLSSASAALLPAGPASVVATLEADCNRLLAEHLHARMQRSSGNAHEGVPPTATVHADSTSDPLPRTLPPSQAPVTGSWNTVPGGDASLDSHAKTNEIPHMEYRPGTSFTDPDGLNNDSPASRVTYAMTFRLRLLDPYHQLWYQAVALRARMPRTALRNRLLLADEVAAYANYNTPDVSWYADRAVIATIYQAAELYWIADASPGRRDTVHFLRHRLEDAHSLRSSLTRSFTRFMNIRDATFNTANTLFRASRSSY